MFALKSSSRKSLGLLERSHPITSKKLHRFAFGGPRPAPSKPGGRTAPIARLVCYAIVGGLSGFGLVWPAAASTKTWKAGTDGYYTAGVNWLGGIAPGPGDTAVITGSRPWFTNSQGTQGDTISRQTLNFETSPGSSLVAVLGQTTFTADTTVNVVGGSPSKELGGTDADTHWWAFYNNALNGTINVGSPTATGCFTVDVLDYGWGLKYTPTTTNNGTIAIGRGSVFHINPHAGGAAVGQNVYNGYFYPIPLPDQGYANFTNNGLITLAPGADFEDSWATAGSGYYNSTLINNGTIRLQGASGVGTVAEINAHLAGTGTILLDGRNASHAGATVLRITGNMSGQHIVALNAGVEVHDLFNVARVTGGSLTFGAGSSYLLVYPEDGYYRPGYATDVLPFGMPIKNFRVGNAIAIWRAVQFGIETFRPVWDQQTHRLTVWVTNSLHPGVTSPIAMFTLEGNYSPNDFRVAFDGSSRPTQIDITTTNNSPRTP